MSGNRISTDMPAAAYSGQVSADASSSERLLEIIRGLEFDGDYRHAGVWEHISWELSSINPSLAEEWSNVESFFSKVRAALEENLSVVRNELELYSTSSVSIEEELVSVVQEVISSSESILKKLGLS